MKAARDVGLRAEATLERLISDLGGAVVEVLSAPHGLGVTLAQAVIHDAADDLEIEPGDVVLGVGVRDADAAAVVEGAARSGAVAVLVKLRTVEVRDRLVTLAEAADVALVSVAPEITWAQLHALVRTSIVSAGQVASEASGFGTPVGDLFALANAVAAMVGGPTTIEDPQSRVMAYSSDDQTIDEGRRQTILGRQVPEYYVKRLHEQGVFRRLWGSDDVLRLDDIEGPDGSRVRPRLAVAVRAGQEILGSIWVAEGDTPLGADAEEALRHASQIAALHLVRNRSGEALERRMRGELLRSLLDGRGPSNVLADRLDLDPLGGYVVLGFELQTTEDAEVALQRERALDLIALYCEAFRRRSVQVGVGRTVYTLLPVGEDARPDSVTRLARDVLERSREALSVRLHVAVSSTVERLREAPRAREEVDQILRVLAEGSDTGVFASFDDVRARALLLELRDHVAARPHLLEGKVQRLVEADGEEGVYVDTLRAYLDSFGDVPAAAKALDVHPNTFRYRLRRVSEVADLDLDDPVERLAAELQLRLR